MVSTQERGGTVRLRPHRPDTLRQETTLAGLGLWPQIIVRRVGSLNVHGPPLHLLLNLLF